MFSHEKLFKKSWFNPTFITKYRRRLTSWRSGQASWPCGWWGSPTSGRRTRGGRWGRRGSSCPISTRFWPPVARTLSQTIRSRCPWSSTRKCRYFFIPTIPSTTTNLFLAFRNMLLKLRIEFPHRIMKNQE